MPETQHDIDAGRIEVPVDGTDRTNKTRPTGTPVQRNASLHENAVQAIARGEVTVQPVRTRKPPQKRTQPLDYHHQLNPMLLEYVQKQIDDPECTYTRYEVLDGGEAARLT